MLPRTLCRSRSYRFVDGVDGAGSHSKEGKSTEEQAVHRGTPHLHHGVLKWHRQQEEGQDEVHGDDPRQDLQLVKRSLKTVPPLEFAVRIQRHGRVRRHLRRLWVHACTISHSDFTGASPCRRYAEGLSIGSQGHSHCTAPQDGTRCSLSSPYGPFSGWVPAVELPCSMPKLKRAAELADTQSVYEEQRAANIARNERVLAALGLASPPTPTTVRRAAPREGSANSERLRRGKSERLRGARRPAAPAVMPELDAAAVSLDARPGQTAVTRPLVFGDAARAAGSSGSFASRVLKVVRAIPRGKVASYGQCAALAGSPNKARQVGKLLALGLAAHGAPWQRVINSGGSISLPAHVSE